MTTFNVNEGGDLQYFLDKAQQGDQILLQAGVQFIGNFHLPAKQSTPQPLPDGLPGTPKPYHIVISSNSSDPQFPKPGCRIDPSQHAAMLPKLISPNKDAALSTDGPTDVANTWAYGSWVLSLPSTTIIIQTSSHHVKNRWQARPKL